MKPGFYTNLSMEEYLDIPAISRSVLRAGRGTTDLHMLRAYNTPAQETPSMLMGSLTHAMILEPNTVDKLFVRMPNVDRRTREGKAAWADAEHGAGGRSMVRHTEWETCEEMARAAREHRLYKTLIADATHVEATYVWESGGVKLKCRPDVLHVRDEIGEMDYVDIKTARDLDDKSIERAIYDHAYHIQAAMVMDASACPMESFMAILVFVQNRPPYDVRVVAMDNDWLLLGHKEYEDLLHRWQLAASGSGSFAAWDDMEVVGPPRWIHNAVMAQPA